ncbi:hypothetical protein [Halioxenophilus sp. WMMB6]|uniref:hypothetical protein n=1 Tax=Halioxenophilus sp. WMMB6 TaxID=3073815 RepID=UPI00295F38F3|nr:hypothetical protein [Halioxenophilus sp. WMMB6]
MKVHIEVDLSPQEARELMGLDGVDQMQRLFLKAISGEVGKEGYPMMDFFQAFVKQGQDALESYRKAMEAPTKNKSSGGSEH